MAHAIVLAVQVYLGLGVLLGVPFALFGAARIDPNAKGAGLGFKLMILPGAVLMWPFVVGPWLKGPAHQPVESNAHRDGASGGEGLSS